jgi:hypothetical protein
MRAFDESAGLNSAKLLCFKTPLFIPALLHYVLIPAQRLSFGEVTEVRAIDSARSSRLKQQQGTTNAAKHSCGGR